MQVSFASKRPSQCQAFIIAVHEGANGLKSLTKLDATLGNMVKHIEKTGSFKGKEGQTLLVAAPGDASCPFVMLVGVGKKLHTDEASVTKLGGTIFACLNNHKLHHASIHMGSFEAGKEEASVACMLAFGANLRSYNFDRYFSDAKKEKKAEKTSLTVVMQKPDNAKKLYAYYDAVAQGVYFTRDVVSMPANHLNPPSYAKEIEKLKKDGLKVEVLGEKEMEKLGMGSLLGVGQGSDFESKLVVMQWNGGKKSSKPLAFVGKGVTFDTGGISIKPALGMDEMKYDMGGSGVVVGLMKSLALRKAKVNAVGVVGLVENMPGGHAQRPGDIVTSMSGQTIEVLNTDAEGRLVLADALWYCQDRFKPEFMVNLATLTGAIVITLGNIHAGLFSNNDTLSKRLEASGKAVGETSWRLPISDDYDKQIDSPIADMQNIGNEKGAGSITAAQFLHRFVNKVPWAHLDIAGVAWTKKDLPVAPKGATAWGVRMLDHFVKTYYEK